MFHICSGGDFNLFSLTFFAVKTPVASWLCGAVPGPRGGWAPVGLRGDTGHGTRGRGTWGHRTRGRGARFALQLRAAGAAPFGVFSCHESKY